MRNRQLRPSPASAVIGRPPAALSMYGDDVEDTEEVSPYERLTVRRKPEVAGAHDIDADVIAAGIDDDISATPPDDEFPLDGPSLFPVR